MWRFESNDHQDIELHDNFINKIIVEDGNILLVFSDGFDVVKTHPLNNTQKSKHTTESQITLLNAQFIKGNVFIRKDEKREFDYSELTKRFVHFMVSQFKIENDELYLFGNLDADGLKSEAAEIWFYCSDVIFCWNDYSSDAWFEGWPKRT